MFGITCRTGSGTLCTHSECTFQAGTRELDHNVETQGLKHKVGGGNFWECSWNGNRRVGCEDLLLWAGTGVERISGSVLGVSTVGNPQDLLMLLETGEGGISRSVI